MNDFLQKYQNMQSELLINLYKKIKIQKNMPKAAILKATMTNNDGVKKNCSEVFKEHGIMQLIWRFQNTPEIKQHCKKWPKYQVLHYNIRYHEGQLHEKSCAYTYTVQLNAQHIVSHFSKVLTLQKNNTEQLVQP